MYNRPTLWLTRPQLDSEIFAAMLAEKKIKTIVAPVLSVGSIFSAELEAANNPDVVLLTSRHAVPALASKRDSWGDVVIYCVGEATAEQARAAGFCDIHAGDADVKALLARMVNEIAAGSHITYLSGDQTRINAAALLRAQGYHVAQYVTYHAVAETTLPRPLMQAFNANQLNGVVFFSPRSATLASKLISRAGLLEQVPKVKAYCLSLAIASAAGTLPWKEILSCNSPTLEAMHALIVSHKHRKLL